MKTKNTAPVWVIIVSMLISLLEIMVSLTLCFSPESVLETVDLGAKGVLYVVYMWAARQFALGFIFGLAAVKRSLPMLTLAYVFLLVMFVGDVAIGVVQKENTLIVSAAVMCVLAVVMLLILNKKKLAANLDSNGQSN